MKHHVDFTKEDQAASEERFEEHEAALEFLFKDVPYMERGTLEKMARDGRSVTYEAFMAGIAFAKRNKNE